MVPGHSFGGERTFVVGSHALKYGDRTVSGVTGGEKLAATEEMRKSRQKTAHVGMSTR